MNIRFLLPLALLVSSQVFATSAADEAISAYILPPQRLEFHFRASLPALVQQRPDLKSDLEYVAKRFKGAELSSRNATLLTSGLTDADRNYILTFMETSGGKLFGRIQAEKFDQRSQMNALAQIPIGQRRPIDQFVVSIPVRKAVGILNSEAAAQLNETYGKELRCDYLKTIVPDEYRELVKLGQCPRMPE